MLRPAVAAARFGVARQTLIDWADKGLIGRARVGRVVLYPSQDIADLIARNLTPRTIVPMASATTSTPAADDSAWQDDPFWTGAAR